MKQKQVIIFRTDEADNHKLPDGYEEVRIVCTWELSTGRVCSSSFKLEAAYIAFHADRLGALALKLSSSCMKAARTYMKKYKITEPIPDDAFFDTNKALDHLLPEYLRTRKRVSVKL